MSHPSLRTTPISSPDSKKNYLNDSARSDGAAGGRRDEAEREDVRVGGEHGAAARPEEGDRLF